MCFKQSHYSQHHILKIKEGWGFAQTSLSRFCLSSLLIGLCQPIESLHLCSSCCMLLSISRSAPIENNMCRSSSKPPAACSPPPDTLPPAPNRYCITNRRRGGLISAPSCSALLPAFLHPTCHTAAKTLECSGNFICNCGCYFVIQFNNTLTRLLHTWAQRSQPYLMLS